LKRHKNVKLSKVGYERSFVKLVLNLCVVLQMAIPNRDAIEMFADKLEKLPESVEDDNGNDNYLPKEDFMGEWTALPDMLDDGTFALRLVYELNTKADQPEEWVQMATWETESVEAQGNYVILNMKYNDDHVNILMEYLMHTFSHNYAINNVSEEGKRFDLDKLFGKYSLS
jgi:hypothetical protein